MTVFCPRTTRGRHRQLITIFMNYLGISRTAQSRTARLVQTRARLVMLLGLGATALATAQHFHSAPAVPAAKAAPTAPAAKPTVATEAQHHPRIARAIRELEDAIKYMQAAPHDFGGHKAKAIQIGRAHV